MFFKKKTIQSFLFLLLHLTYLNASGQIDIPHSLSGYFFSVSDFGQMNFAFLDSGKCIRLSNGLATLSATPSSPAFSIACLEKQSNTKDCPLVAYPNPAHNFVKIKFAGCKEGRTDGTISLRIFNILGQLVSEKNIPVISLLTGLNFDLTHLPNGAYFICRNTEDNNQALKIIKIYEK
jgi:hypothetical protein